MGVLVTILIQRSAATDMMVIGFVNSGLMTLMQAIGVIMGANIGTTITAQITAFNKAICHPAVALRQAQLEITRMGRIASENLNSSVNASSIQPTINIDKSRNSICSSLKSTRDAFPVLGAKKKRTRDAAFAVMGSNLCSMRFAHRMA